MGTCAGKKLSIETALPLMIDIADGVAELHERGVVFCDLKAQNVSSAARLGRSIVASDA